MKQQRDDELWIRAKKVIPGGTNSSARFTTDEFGVAGWTGIDEYKGLPLTYPRFLERANGTRLYDVDGNEYIDYNCTYGPIILGHSHPKVNEAVRNQLEKGNIYGMNHEDELKLSEKLVSHIPCADMVTIMNVGSEVTSTVVRLARVHTGKKKIIKFNGHYHGWHDWATVKSNPYGVKIVDPGVPTSLIDDVITLPWNNLEILDKTLTQMGNEVALVITEAYQCNGGVIPPKKGYLEGLRKLTTEHNVLLVFDEVITGFRFGLGGAGEMLGIVPDLATFSKSMANGFPIAAFGGKRSILQSASPPRGTFNSNPVSTAAALATITELENKTNYENLYKVSKALMNGLKDAISDSGVAAIIQGPGPAFSIYFTDLEEITEYNQVTQVKTKPHVERRVTFYREMLKRGIYIHPYDGTRIYLSCAHTMDDAEKAIEAASESLKISKSEV